MKVIFRNLRDCVGFEDLNVDLHIIIGIDKNEHLFRVDENSNVKCMLTDRLLGVFDESFAKSCEILEAFDNEVDAQIFVLHDLGRSIG